MVSPVTPAPNTVTRMATMVLQRQEGACRIGCALSRQIVMSREFAESERTGVVRLATPNFKTRSAGSLHCICGSVTVRSRVRA